MGDPSKRKSSIFQESLLIIKGQKTSHKAQTIADLSDLNRPFTLLADVQPLWSEHLRFSASLISYSLLTALNSKAIVSLQNIKVGAVKMA